jgi:alcohol dehydrogenase class IV
MYQYDQPFRFVHRADVAFGKGRAAKIPDEMAQLGVDRPVIVTDPTLTEVGVIDPIVEALEADGFDCRVYDEVEPNPRVSTVETGAALLTDEGYDGVIGVGGGSSMDTAKAMAGLATNGGSIADYEGLDNFGTDPVPTVTVPTTIGTGSEVTSATVITHPDRDEKLGILDDRLIPDVAVLDPTLLGSLPAHVAASTGMDCLTQSVMAYVSTDSNPITDALTRAAVEMIAENLPAAVAKKDLDALMNMQIATTIEGSGFMNAGLGLVHAMSHPVSAHYDTPHGVTNGVILPAVLEYNRIAREEKYADLAAAMGTDTRSMSTREASEAFIDEVRDLSRAVGIPEGLSELGVEESFLPELAEATVTRKDTSRNKSTNPRTSTEEDVLEIYRQAY